MNTDLVNNVRMLRLSVTELFSTLADNGPEPHQDLTQYVSSSINKIHTILRTLDEGVEHLTGPAMNLFLGESAHLGHDLASERNNLYNDLCKAFKTYDNMHEYAAHCTALLSQQSLKRSQFLSSSAMVAVPRVDKSQRRALYNPYNQMQLNRVSANGQTQMDISDLITNYVKPFPTMEVLYSRPFGCSTGFVQLSLNKVLKAVLVLRGKVLDFIIIKAYHESFTSSGAHATKPADQTKVTDTSATAPSSSDFVEADNEVDIWSESKYLVFRKITQQANSAMLHFQYPQYPEIALKSFLAWLNSYSNLFSASCTKCNSRLRNFLPPICRDNRAGFEPHHESCR